MKSTEKILAILSLLAIIGSFVAGSLRSQDALSEQMKAIVPNLTTFESIAQDIYEINTDTNEKLIFALAEHPGYAGPMLTGIIVNQKGIIETVSIVDSPDTRPYIEQVLNAKIPDAYLGKSMQDNINPDSVSGATLSSVALKDGIAKAAFKIMTNSEILANYPELNISEESISKAKVRFADQSSIQLSTTEIIKVLIVVSFFIVTAFVASKKFPWSKKNARYVLMAASVVLLGFMYGAQFSISTLILLISGVWIVGLASYAPLICLVLALVSFIFTKKNLYCMYICPFGALQEGVSMITSCKMLENNTLLKWASRFFALALICFAFYFSQPSAATYEPFGKTFNFVGSVTLFMLSSSIIVFSLFLKKPWCRLLCPMTPLFDYTYFWRNWLFKSKNPQTVNEVE